MSCRRAHKLLALEAGGDLAVWRSWRLQRHLRGCAACRHFAEDLRGSRAALLSLLQEEIPETVRHGLQAGLRKSIRTEGQWTPVVGARPVARRPWVYALAASLVVAVGLSVLWRVGSRLDPLSVSGSLPSEPVRALQGQHSAGIAHPESQQRKETSSAATSTRRRASAQSPVATPLPNIVVRHVESQEPAPPDLDPEPLLIKLVSEDPDLVIYWLVDPEENKNEPSSV